MVQRRDSDYISRRMMEMEPGKRSRGRTGRRYMDVLKEDMKSVREENAEDSVRRKQKLKEAESRRN